MDHENVFRIILAVLVVVMYVPRRYYQELSRRTVRGGLRQDRDEKRTIASQTVILGLSMVGLIVILIKPAWMAWSTFSIPDWLRWVGVVLTTLGTSLLIWTHVTLGDNFFGGMKLREEHKLVTEGPYRYVRHPMYLAFITLGFGYLFLPANWFIGGTWLFGTLLTLLSRHEEEEEMLIEEFGDDYSNYMDRTGKFFPRF
jgi:protein-S-isoprenylcysteine O-methyltransferase Ste14